MQKVTGHIKLQIPAGAANPAPPVGPALGRYGVNIMGFCKEFNAQTADKSGWIIPVEITVYADRSFTFKLKTPPVSDMIKKAIKIERGSKSPKADKVGRMTKAQVREIAQAKIIDMNAENLESAMRMVEGTARSMGVVVEEG